MSDEEIQKEIERRWRAVQEVGKDFRPIWEMVREVSALAAVHPRDSAKQLVYRYLYSASPSITCPPVDDH